MFKLLPCQDVRQRVFHTIKDESYTAFAHHRLQYFWSLHQIRKYRHSSNHIGCQHNINKFRQCGTKNEKFVSLTYTHAFDDAAPQMHLLNKMTTTHVAAKVD